jgi:hypothetical protein
MVSIKQGNPALNDFKLEVGKRYNFSFWTEDPENQFAPQNKHFSENDTIEITET